MSQENVETVRLISADWAGGDYASVDWAHPDTESVGTDGAVTRGIDELGSGER